MALSLDASKDFKTLVARLGDYFEEPPGDETDSNLQRLLLIARDEFDDDEINELLNKYSFEPVTEITKGVTRACRRVCKITNGGGPSTGILVSPDLVLTAGHALHGAETTFPLPSEVKIFFDEFRFSGDALVHSLPCKVQTTSSGMQLRIVASSNDEELDYVIFQLESPIGLNRLGTSRRRRRGWMDVSTVNVAPEGKVIVLEHPGGKLMKVAEGIVDPDTTGLPPGRFRYVTETEAGSSGSPVLNQARQLVGLHVKKQNSVQQLISFTAIFEDLKQKQIRMPRYPPPESFTDPFLKMMLAPQGGPAFT